LLKVTLTILALLTFPAHASDVISKEKLTSLLIDAEDYLSVKPSKSLKILSTQYNLSSLSESQFFRWHIASIRVALSFNNLSVMENSIKELITHKSTTEFEHRLVPILSSIGIWLRKSGYPEQAKLTLVCALTHNKIEENKVRLLISIAIASRYLNQNNDAINTYNLAKSIAENENISAPLATIENNLGVIILENDDVTSAEHHFRSALARYQANSNRSGNVISGINLLQTFLIQDKQLDYQRLFPTITRLTKAFPNESRQGTLFWLNTVFQMRQGLKLNKQILSQLEKSFYKISDPKLQFSLRKHFAQELSINVELPIQNSPQKLAPLWFSEISQCNWKELMEFTFEDLK
jgi:tetratricopeptide (TPR) repeat protein